MADEATQQQGDVTVETLSSTSELDSLLRKDFKPQNDQKADAIKGAVLTLAEQALSEAVTISDDAIETIERILSEIDKKLSDQVNEIMHHDAFRKLEGTWRGMQHLVSNTETDQKLKIRVLNVSKKEITKTVKKNKGTAWDQSPLFKSIYEAEYGMPGGEPYGCLIGDFEFDHSPEDVLTLKGIAQVASAAHSPFFAAAAPSLYGMESWQELSNFRDLKKIQTTPEYASWNSFRESDDSRYMGLTMPRFLSRLPYGAKTCPVEEFAFEESTDGKVHDHYVWSNSAYAFGVNVNRAFKEYGWTSRIRGRESGGVVEGLPVHTFPTDEGGPEMKCPTEIAITDRRSKELDDCGLLPLSHWKGTDLAVFIGGQSLNQPKQYEDPDATANAELSARFPYLFSTCRFAHYLKCIVRDKIGSFKEREDMERWLNSWIKNYTIAGSPSEADKARKPLAEAEVKVQDVEGNPGYYSAQFYLRPHYQLEGLKTSLRLVSKLPSAKQG